MHGYGIRVINRTEVGWLMSPGLPRLRGAGGEWPPAWSRSPCFLTLLAVIWPLAVVTEGSGVTGPDPLLPCGRSGGRAP